jgi:transposase InsO family protein
LAKLFGLRRSNLYYASKQKSKDAKFLIEIKKTMEANPSYGSPRIALALGVNHKRVERVMKANQIKAFRRRRKHFKPDDLKQDETKYSNQLKNLCVVAPRAVYATDFTYIDYQGKFLYLATVIDVFSREIVGWDISDRHTADMMKRALEMAFKEGIPVYLHSDQGSEMKSEIYTNLAESNGVKISMSQKASPWQNGFQESFYSGFKLDLGDPNRFELKGELIEAIIQNLNYYNNDRIHTSLKTSPSNYFKQYEIKKTKLLKTGN